MSRLLFAAARGARFQMRYLNSWHNMELAVVLSNPSCESRIHPDDEHLQYGPISSALRERAEFPPHDLDDALPTHPNIGLYMPYEVYLHGKAASDMHRSLFLLILAEALADEGL